MPEPEETDSPSPKAHMQRHLDAALRVRNAVIAGDLERAKVEVRWLGSHVYPETLPPSWRSHAERMQTAAKHVDTASDLGSAAAAVGALGAACGACHRHIGGPKREPSGFESEADEDLPERMYRHAWAAERMWEGLITPWDEAWKVGAEVLTEGRFRTKPEAGLAAALADDLARTQALGRDALTTREQHPRGMMYGRLLVRCAECHSRLGIKPF